MTTDQQGGVFAGTTAGSVWATTDAGEHWSELPIRLPRVLSVEVIG